MCLKFLRQQATVSVVCNGLAKSLCPISTFSDYMHFYKLQSKKRLKHRLLRYLQTPLPWVRFSANFRLTSERPLDLFFDTKNTFRLCLKFLRQQATVSVVCNGLATSLLPHFHIFRLHTLLQIAKQKTPQTPLTTVLANALAVESFFLGKFPLNIGTSVGFVF